MKPQDDTKTTIHEEVDVNEQGGNSEEVIETSEQKRIQELEKLLEEEKNLRLRALADYQNLKARAEREREELIQYAQTGLLMKLFEIIDDFKIFLDSSETTDDAWRKGIVLVYQKLLDILKGEGVEMMHIDDKELFDPSIHEAITFMPATQDEDEGKIAQVISNGYRRIGDGKVIRTAKVIVFKKS